MTEWTPEAENTRNGARVPPAPRQPGRAEWQLWPLRATTPIPSHEHTCRAPHSSCAHIPEEGVNQAPDWLSFLIWLQGSKTRPTIRLSRPVHSGKPLVPSLVQSLKLSRCVPSNTLAAGGSPASHDTHVGTKYPLGKLGARESTSYTGEGCSSRLRGGNASEAPWASRPARLTVGSWEGSRMDPEACVGVQSV